MSYKESQLDSNNRKWFQNDKSKNTLLSISVSDGNIRGVYDSEINFSYPICALVGENGSGKTTFLSLIACAFHNNSDFCPLNKMRINNKKPHNYYSYGDFFTFAPMEVGIKGIRIKSKYLSSSGQKEDIRKKKPSGKWNDYISRPKRIVSFLGINRILPPAESSPHKHYYKSFSSDLILIEDEMNDIKIYMSRIFGRQYKNVQILSYNAYRLFSAECQSMSYTGFNMGAGENAALELLVEILSAGKGALLVVDEIELGLHAKAQMELIQVLKEICNKNHNQIICSTHSKIILDALPVDARMYIRRLNNTTEIIPNISSEFAFGRLSGQPSRELDVFVEDEVGQCFLESLIPKEIRQRICIYTVGSADAILRQMAAHYREKKYNFIAFQDGDMRTSVTSSIGAIKNYLEGRIDHSDVDFDSLMKERLCFLPSNAWPERVLVEYINKKEDFSFYEEYWGASNDEVSSAFEKALASKKHNEFYDISNDILQKVATVRTDIMRQFRIDNPNEAEKISEKISNLLKK